MSLSIGLLSICRQKISKITCNIAIAVSALSIVHTPAMADSGASSTTAHTDVRVETKIDKKIPSNAASTDPKFQALHSSWGGNIAPTMSLSIPSIDPVTKVDISSYYGYRTDPFRGRRKNHKGLDIRGPVGTPIYATADGFVKISKWFGSYGKFIEIDHGNGITTRYGHMSRLKVSANMRVKKGDIIGLMGSTGRSTGSHLHYEVRVAGEPVNPLSFMSQSSNPVKFADKSKTSQAQGGPAQ